jgi:hypothetical protein
MSGPTHLTGGLAASALAQMWNSGFLRLLGWEALWLGQAGFRCVCHGGEIREGLTFVSGSITLRPAIMSVHPVLELITSRDPEVRNRPLDQQLAGVGQAELLVTADALEAFRRQSSNLYERVRALFFLYAIHRFHLPPRFEVAGGSGRSRSLVPFDGYEHLLNRRFEEAIQLSWSPSGRRDRVMAFPAPGGCLPSVGVSNPGRPSAAQCADGARQPVDVSHGAPCGPRSAVVSGAAGHPTRTVRIRSCANGHRCGWT